MKKRLLSLLLAVAMLVAVSPLALATEQSDENSDPVAQSVDGDITSASELVAALGGESYATASDDTVTLQQGVTLSTTITISGSITLDLNGKTLTNSGDGHTIVNDGTLTIQDTGTNGTVSNTSNGCAALWNNGTAYLNGGTFQRTDTDGNSYYTVVNRGTMTVDGATISNSNTLASCLENGWYNNDSNGETAYLTIQSGTITGGMHTVKNDDGGDLTIEGGTITGNTTYTVLNYNVAKITGGTITNSSTTSASSAVCNLVGSNPNTSAGEMTIEGGTFNGVYAVVNNNGSMSIGSGTFNGTSSGLSTDAGSNTTITGGEFKGGEYYGLTAKGAVTIDSGAFTGGSSTSYGCAVRTGTGSSAKITINGGMFTPGSGKYTLYQGSSGSTITVTGGDFTGGTAGVIFKNSKSPLDSVSLRGGTYSTNKLVSDYVATGYEAKPDNETSPTSWTVGRITDKLVVSGNVSGTTVSGDLTGSFATDTTVSTDGTTGGSGVTGNAVTVDLTTANDSTTATSTTLTIQQETAATLDGASSLILKTDAGTVELDSTALATVSEAKSAVTLTVEKAEHVAAVELASYTVTLKDNTGNLLPYGQNKGKVTITVPKAEGATQVWYVTGDASNRVYVDKLAFEDLNDGTIAYTINHLSTTVQTKATPDNTAVAQLGSDYYSSLSAAISAIEGRNDKTGTITLVDNTQENVTIPAGVTVTLDLNGKTLTNDTSSTTAHTITNNGTLTIQDNSAEGTGTVDNVSHAKAAVYNNVGGTVTLSGGAYTRSKESGTSTTDSGSNSYYTLVNQGTMTVDGANVHVSQGENRAGRFSSMVENGWYDGSKNSTKAPAKLIIKNGTFVGGLNTIKNDDWGEVTIEGGAFFNASQTVVQNHNTATISGGTFTASNDATCVVYNHGWNETMGTGKLTISNGTFSGGNYAVIDVTEAAGAMASKVTITGGQFAGSTAAIGKSTNEAYSYGTIAVSGGSFSSSVPVDYLDESLTAELYSTNQNPAAPYSYYKTVEAALKDARPGDQITDLSQAGGEPSEPVTIFSVTFKSDHGTVPQGYVVTAGTSIELPTLSSQGYNHFMGWIDQDGNQYKGGDEAKISKNTTFTAQWVYIPPVIVVPGSAVSVAPAVNGTVTVNPTSAAQGSAVTVTVTPDQGYELSSLTVTDASGRSIALTANANGTYTFTMPAGAVTIQAVFARIEEKPTLAFTDVPANAYYYDAVCWAVDNGVTNGTGATTFTPDRTVTRAEMVTFLWRAYGCPEPQSSTTPFTDVSSSAYYYDAVLWAVENGITNGTSAATFGPEVAVTRAQAVTFQWRAAGSPAVTGSSFSDVEADAYYAGAVAWAVAMEVTNGTSAAAFSPEAGVSRAQAVTFLYRQLG